MTASRMLILTALLSTIGLAQTASVNYVRTTTYPNGIGATVPNLSALEQPNSTYLKSIGYFNGWAQPIQSQSISDVSSHVILSRNYYDNKGRLIITSKPLMKSVTDSLNFKSLDMTGYLTDAANSDSTYERMTYYDETQDRAKYRMPYGATYHDVNRALKFDVDYDPYLNAIRSVTTDEDQISQYVYQDAAGRKVRQVTPMASGNLTTLFVYDGSGNLIETSSPEGAKNPITAPFFVEKTVAFCTPPSGYLGDDSSNEETPRIFDRQWIMEQIRAQIEKQQQEEVSVLALEENPCLGSDLVYNKPPRALSASVTLSYSATSGGCPFQIDLEYAINHGKWTTVLNATGPIQLTLKDEDRIVEFRRKKLINTGTGCTLPVVKIRIDATAQVVDSAKYTTVYRYDVQNRLVYKRSPDEGEIKYVYDTKGQLRFVQDENHRAGLKLPGQYPSYWTYYKYDGLGRMIEQGELMTNHSLSFLQSKTIANLGGCQSLTTTIHDSTWVIDEWIHYNYRDTTYYFNCVPMDTVYGAKSFPQAADNPFVTAVNQYDIYDGSWQITFASGDTAGSFTRGRLTRSKIRDLNASNWSEEMYAYDRYGRVSKRWVYIPELAASKKFQYYYDVSGRVLKTAYQDGQSDAFYQWFRYDNLSRLDTVFSSKTNYLATAVREAVYDYENNNGGKVKQTKIGQNTIQTVDYTYTVRDWLKSINDVNNIGADKFAETLFYGDAAIGPRYNGNIAQMSWNTNGNVGAYRYTYDNANRLTDAIFGIVTAIQGQTISGTYTNSTGDSTWLKDNTISSGATATIQSKNGLLVQAGFTSSGATVTLRPGVSTAGSGSGAGDYSERNIVYDANGNILSLTRGTSAAMVYTYDSQKPNRLNTVGGGYSSSYSYDVNGNMLKDNWNKMGYDYRNMPINDTLSHGKIIRFAYDAGGQRIKYLRYASNGTTLLDSSRIYVLNSNGKIMAEYIKISSNWNLEHYNIYGNSLIGKLNSSNQRYYNLEDHLGSVRVTLKDSSGTAVIDSWSDYYPFGKESRSSASLNKPREQFTGKERDVESGLDYFGARYYNADIARFTTLDPLRQKFPQWTPYAYAGNMPVHLIDVDGKGPGDPNKYEIALATAHPVAAGSVYLNRNVAQNQAVVYAGEMGTKKLQNNEVDAFRHALWSALNARDIGGDLAKKFGDAHEMDPDQSLGEARMDLFNNAAGYEIGIANPDATDADMVQLVKDAMGAGKLQLVPEKQNLQISQGKDDSEDANKNYSKGSGSNPWWDKKIEQSIRQTSMKEKSAQKEYEKAATKDPNQ